jgi:hypothetical protein
MKAANTVRCLRRTFAKDLPATMFSHSNGKGEGLIEHRLKLATSVSRFDRALTDPPLRHSSGACSAICFDMAILSCWHAALLGCRSYRYQLPIELLAQIT